MKLKLYCIGILFVTFACSNSRASMEEGFNSFKKVYGQGCDVVEEKLQNQFVKEKGREMDNFELGDLGAENAECWRRSMILALNKRLLNLKKSDTIQFKNEMALQKNFNEATSNYCDALNNSIGSSSRGNTTAKCYASAYAYRTTQSEAIEKGELFIPASHKKVSEAGPDDFIHYYKVFAEQLCKMPKSTWKEKAIPVDCVTKAMDELYEVCG